MFSRNFFPAFFTPGMFGPTAAVPPACDGIDDGQGAGPESEAANYPFVAPSADVAFLLADLWISHHVTAVVGKLRVTAMYNFDRVFTGTLPAPDQHTADIVVKDDNDLVIVDTTTATSYRGVYFGRRFFIHDWTFSDRTCRVVQYRCVSSIYPGPVPASITPENGILDERSYELVPARLLAIQVGDAILTGDIKFVAGWNMEISQNPVSGQGATIIKTDALRGPSTLPVITQNSLQFSAVAGAGLGLYPGCVPTAELGLRTINTVAPSPTGDFRLSGVGCLYVTPPFIIDNPSKLLPHALQIGNQCGPCRPCNDYVDAYRELRDVFSNLTAISARAQHDRDQLDTAITTIAAVQRGCAKSITVAATGGKDFNATTIAVSVQVTNNTASCYKNVSLSVHADFAAITSPYIPHAGGFKVDEGGHVLPWYDAAFPDFTTTWPELIAGASVRVHFVLAWFATPPATPPTGTFTLTASATCDTGSIPVGGAAETAVVTESIM
jgi:hypothetical protein